MSSRNLCLQRCDTMHILIWKHSYSVPLKSVGYAHAFVVVSGAQSTREARNWIVFEQSTSAADQMGFKLGFALIDWEWVRTDCFALPRGIVQQVVDLIEVVAVWPYSWIEHNTLYHLVSPDRLH